MDEGIADMLGDGRGGRHAWRQASTSAPDGQKLYQEGMTMSTRNSSLAALICAALALQAPGIGARAVQDPKHDHQQAAAKPTADHSAKCQAMKADRAKMMTQMKAADERLDGLVAKMTAATGHSQIDATAAAVAEIVAQRKTMREQMMKGHEDMMHHMMEHMQGGKESMAMCPMMKMGGMKP